MLTNLRLKRGSGALVGRQLPKAKASEKRISIVAEPRVRGQTLQLFRISAPQHDVVRLQRLGEFLHDVGYVPLPFLLA